MDVADAEFVAAARKNLPLLVAEVRASECDDQDRHVPLGSVVTGP